MSKRTEVVLLDSDEEEQPPLKFQKVETVTINLIKKPYMSSDNDDDDDDDDEEDDDDDDVEQQNIPVNHNVSESTSEFGSSSSSSSPNSDSDSKSLNEPISIEEYKAVVNEEAPNTFQDPTQVPPEVRLETRKYLKAHGIMKFLERYLPTTASSDDILSLILKLGFLPKDISDYNEEENLIRLIRILNLAMKKTISMRNRLTNFTTVDEVLDKILTANKIMVITGAGISTSLGIPDFRSSQGFYNQLQHLGLSDPQEVFDLEFFHQDPTIFYLIAHMILPPQDSFTPLHAFIKLLQDKGKLLRNYTQNIDNLEGVVGIEEDKLIQCHGSFATALCVTCGYHIPGEGIFAQIRAKEVAYCPKCNSKREKLLKKEDVYLAESYGVMKPDITFFGEPLPLRFHRMIKQDITECDLLICIGTSLKVAPVSHILERVPEDIPQVLINKDPIDHFNLDVSLLGYCDEVAAYLCNKLGWDLGHKDYDKIRGEGGKNLELVSVEGEEGTFHVNAIKTEEENN